MAKNICFRAQGLLSNSAHLFANKLCLATLNDSFACLKTAVGNFLLEMQKFLWSYFILEWTCRVQQILVLASMKICRPLERMLTEDLWVVNPLLALEWRFIGDPETGIGTGSIFACSLWLCKVYVIFYLSFLFSFIYFSINQLNTSVMLFIIVSFFIISFLVRIFIFVILVLQRENFVLATRIIQKNSKCQNSVVNYTF